MNIVKILKNRIPGGPAYQNLKHKLKKNHQYKVLTSMPEMRQYNAFLMRPNIKEAWKAYFLGDKLAGGTLEQIKYTIKNSKRMIEEGGESLEFQNIKIPFPLNEDTMISLCYEFSDIMLPYLFPYNRNKYENIDAMFIEGPYELKNVCIEPGDIVFDCGANLGLFSAVAAKKSVGVGEGKIYAFEPSQFVIDNYLHKTAEWNRGINVEPFALSNYVGKAEFSFDENFMSEGKIEKSTGDENNASYINVTTIDEFVKSNGIERVDFIKADIEGEERYMLLGAKETLKRFSPKLSICIYHLPDDPEVLKKIILDANPAYIIEEKYMKLYAYVDKDRKN